MPVSEARQFWDKRAEEDAFFAVDSRLEFGNPDQELFWSEGRKDLDTLLGLAGVEMSPADEIVEIGCGVGRLTRVIAGRAASVRAIDVSERMLELAREHNPELANVSWLLGDGESLAEVESASADGVVSHVVFQHIPDPEVTLGYVREIGRVLRPGGWAAFHISNDPQVHAPETRGAGIRERLGKLVGRDLPWHHQPYWRGSHIEIPRLRAVAAEASMEVEHVTGEGTQWCVVRTRR